VASNISLPGEKNVSRPGQLSDAMAAPQAAASNKRTEGDYPANTISRRVTLSVIRDELYSTA
jgi:hypothetical protein